MSRKSDVLEAPEIPKEIDACAQWLAGEGAGSWFVVNQIDDQTVSVDRYSPVGKLECTGTFRAKQNLLFDSPFVITYPSHCQTVTIIQHQALVSFTRI